MKCKKCNDDYIQHTDCVSDSLCPNCVLEEQAEKINKEVCPCPTCQGLGLVFTPKGDK